MFRTVTLSIISSFSLYTQHWYMVYVIQVLLTACEQDQDGTSYILYIYFFLNQPFVIQIHLCLDRIQLR